MTITNFLKLENNSLVIYNFTEDIIRERVGRLMTLLFICNEISALYIHDEMSM